MDQNASVPAGSALSRSELRAALALALVFFLRMLGLFMLLPVLSLHTRSISGATPLLAGVALGAYGVSQALLQIPFGTWSDRHGRKRVITIGLVVFALGGLVAAFSDSIYGIIAGRLLQGAGAVAAAILALAADLTPDEHRGQAMACIGAGIGFAFICAFIAGPLIDARVGLGGVFLAAAATGLIAIVVLRLWVPDPPRSAHHRECQADTSEIARIWRIPAIRRLNLGVFCLHLILTANFVVLPLMLRDSAGLAQGRHWRVYVPVLIGSAVLMLPWVRRFDTGRSGRPIVLAAIALLALTAIGYGLATPTVWRLALLLTVFFAAFNTLEALLPTLVSRAAPLGARGTAMGLFATAQFLGSFCGGLGGGYLHGAFGANAVFALGAGTALLWLGVAWAMPIPPIVRHRTLHVGRVPASAAAALRRRLIAIPGVTDALIAADDGVAYLLVDPARLDASQLQSLAR
jgi:predicted MFS family arabinose efflux permease